MRTLLVSLALLLTACPDQNGQDCPANTSLIGQYTLTFTGVGIDAGGACVAAADAGPVYLTVPSLGTKGATLCLGSDGGDPMLNLLVAGKPGVNQSELGSDGTFHFSGDPVTVKGTACSCDVLDSETFHGTLIGGTSDGGFALHPDGGLPIVDGLSATSVDTVASAGTGQPCLCTFPCTVTYSISGTRF